MAETSDTIIASTKTVADWKELKPILDNNSNPQLWKEVFDQYFEGRLRVRYFDPIDVLRTNGSRRGEGFAIVAIQCSLIEFFSSTLTGDIYRSVPSKQLGPHEYNASKEVFVTFLSSEAPFNQLFDRQLAEDFYANVRCALLHEARTRNGWYILARSSVAIDSNRKIIYRDNLQDVFVDYVRLYGLRLQRERGLQEAFIRKYESLCD